MKKMVVLVALLGASACSEGVFGLGGQQDVVAAAEVGAGAEANARLPGSQGEGVAPPVRDGADSTQTRPDLPPPPSTTARTVEQFDTTTAEDRAEAVSASSGGARLGATIANLGSPTDPGIWLKTPLVSEITQGRIEFNGNSVNVELRPSGGVAGSGSQISLAAIRLIKAPLTSLPEVTVYAN